MSGGEKRRLHLLSILFRNPNFLILDEPTNDLDLPTLGDPRKLPERLPRAALLIVSHDRYFMDRLVDHLLVLEGDGIIRDFPGNYTQYRDWLKDNSADSDAFPNEQPAAKTHKTAPGDARPASAQAAKKQLSYKEKREFETLEQEIDRLTREKKAITDQLNSGATPFDELQRLSIRVGEISQLLDDKELRWLELSEITRG